MKRIRTTLGLMILLLLMSATHALAGPDVAFTYQGDLQWEGEPVNDFVDLEFRLFTAQTGGQQLGDALFAPELEVVNGLFAVDLFFEDVDLVAEGWLEITINDTALTPRQRIFSASTPDLPHVPGAVVPVTVTQEPATPPASTPETVLAGGTPAVPRSSTNGTTIPARPRREVDRSNDGTTDGFIIRMVEEGGPDGAAWQYNGSDAYYIDGYVAIGLDTPIYPLHVDSGAENVAFFNNTHEGEPAQALYGRATGDQGRGIYGVATHATGITYGIYGKVKSPNGHALYGYNNADDGEGIGVFGKVDSDDGYAGKFEGNVEIEDGRFSREQQDGDGEAVAIDSTDAGAGVLEVFGANETLNARLTYLGAGYESNGLMAVFNASGAAQAGMYVDTAGNGIVWGDSKSFRVVNPADDGTAIWYACPEGPEAAAYCRGTAKLINGEVFIPFPDHFRSVTTLNGMTAQLTPRSAESKGLATVEYRADGIMVKELYQGQGNYEFDYMIMAVRAGHENYRVIRPVAEGTGQLSAAE